jgi:hypothetical protein
MTARDIEKLLALRHSKDVFVAQCKNGASYGGGLQILDAWAMARSWAHPKLSAYEIKVSRSDFLKDDKWRSALDLCNEFWWVCPADLIQPQEVSPECGLLWASKNGTRLYCKKRAQYRTIPDPVSLLYYVIMCRSRIKDGESEPKSQREIWQKWMDESDADKDLGYRVSRKIQELVKTRIDSVDSENDKLRRALKEYEAITPILCKYGLATIVQSDRGEYPVPDSQWSFEKTLRKAQAVIPEDLTARLHRCADELDAIVKPRKEIDK